jgi:hypothetical protein
MTSWALLFDKGESLPKYDLVEIQFIDAKCVWYRAVYVEILLR